MNNLPPPIPMKDLEEFTRADFEALERRIIRAHGDLKSEGKNDISPADMYKQMGIKSLREEGIVLQAIRSLLMRGHLTP